MIIYDRIVISDTGLVSVIKQNLILSADKNSLSKRGRGINTMPQIYGGCKNYPPD